MGYSIERNVIVELSKNEVNHILSVFGLLMIEFPVNTFPTYTSATMMEAFNVVSYVKKNTDSSATHFSLQLSEFDLVFLLRSSGAVPINGLVEKYSKISGLAADRLSDFVCKMATIIKDNGFSI